MSYILYILLGAIQALTEFLPISSSAHLKIIRHLFGIQDGLLLDLSCHLGTLFALLLFLRKDIQDALQKKPRTLLFYALLPLPILYFLLKDLREQLNSPGALGPCLMGTGVILLAGQFWHMTRSKKGGVLDALAIGTMQSIALIPGISRSASTIGCARILGWETPQAVRFSFLLSIPTIVGGNMLEIAKATLHSPLTVDSSVPWGALAVCFLVAFTLGTLCVRKALPWLEKGNWKPCAWYCIILGFFVTLYL